MKTRFFFIPVTALLLHFIFLLCSSVDARSTIYLTGKVISTRCRQQAGTSNDLIRTSIRPCVQTQSSLQTTQAPVYPDADLLSAVDEADRNLINAPQVTCKPGEKVADNGECRKVT